MLQVTKTRAAVFFGDEQADKIQLTGLVQNFLRKGFMQIKLTCHRGEFAHGKFSGCLLDIFVFLGEGEIHMIFPFKNKPISKSKSGFKDSSCCNDHR